MTPLPTSELYTALQTHVVDGQETPLVYVSTQRYFEVQKYASITRHSWSGSWTLVNLDRWRALPPKLQQSLRRRMNEAGLLERQDNARLERSVRDKLTRQGLVFNDVNQSSFKAKLVANGYSTRWKAAFGDRPWSMIEKYTGKLP